MWLSIDSMKHVFYRVSFAFLASQCTSIKNLTNRNTFKHFVFDKKYSQQNLIRKLTLKQIINSMTLSRLNHTTPTEACVWLICSKTAVHAILLLLIFNFNPQRNYCFGLKRSMVMFAHTKTVSDSFSVHHTKILTRIFIWI